MTGRPWWEHAFAVLDFETTSADPATAMPVQVACCMIQPSSKVGDGSWVSLVNPECEIPEEASAIHGITAERLKAEGAVSLETMASEVGQRLNTLVGWPLVIYNATFDWPILQLFCDLPDIYIVDPLLLDRRLDKYRRGSRKLWDTARHYGYTSDQSAHDAYADAQATAHVARALVRRFPSLQIPLDELHAKQVEWHREWADGVNEYWAKKGLDRHADPEWPGHRLVPA